MPFTIIKGTFHVVGYSPDGDSFKFKPRKASNWAKLADYSVRKDSKGNVQLRFEGIDALETHYKSPRVHQPTRLGYPATDLLLDSAGIRNVVWGEKHYEVTEAEDGVEGFILSRAVERFGRPVCFVYSGETDVKDGSEVFLDRALLRKSINYKLIQAGFAYPTYYQGLFYDLREAITAAVRNARSGRKGIWAEDTSSGFTVDGLQSIVDDHVILPKLFRRLVTYLKEHPSVLGFKSWTAQNPEDVLVLPQQHFTHFDNVIEQDGRRIALTVKPEDLVFKP